MPKQKDNILTFYSQQSPIDFVNLAHNVILAEHYSYFCKTQTGFLFEIECNHGGQVFFECNIAPTATGGSIINGKIIKQAWSRKNNSSCLESILVGLASIIFSPLLIFGAIERLIYDIRNKEHLSPYERQAVKFMTTKLLCTYEVIASETQV